MKRASSRNQRTWSNTDIARKLIALSQVVRAKDENPYKARAYRRAANTISNLSQSIDAEVRAGADVTRYPGIGKGIAAALREIVLNGELGQMEMPLAASPAEVAVRDHPQLDVKRVARAFKKLKITTIDELKTKISEGEAGRALGQRAALEFQNALFEKRAILLDDADSLVKMIEAFLLKKPGPNAWPPWERGDEGKKSWMNFHSLWPPLISPIWSRSRPATTAAYNSSPAMRIRPFSKCPPE